MTRPVIVLSDRESRLYAELPSEESLLDYIPLKCPEEAVKVLSFTGEEPVVLTMGEFVKLVSTS